jgi:hypothetical protein
MLALGPTEDGQVEVVVASEASVEALKLDEASDGSRSAALDVVMVVRGPECVRGRDTSETEVTPEPPLRTSGPDGSFAAVDQDFALSRSLRLRRSLSKSPAEIT